VKKIYLLLYNIVKIIYFNGGDFEENYKNL